MKHRLPNFPINVVKLSWVSFLNDIGGETIKKIIPLYLSAVVGVQPSIIGLIEGVADSVPQLLQPLSGIYSDKFAKRKPFIILGQVLRSCVLLLIIANSWFQILLIRIVDRSGKGIANAPRDALVTDSSNPKFIGRSFGLTRAFDNAGAVFGFLLTATVLTVLGVNTDITQDIFRLLVGIAAIPLIIALVIVIFGIRDVLGKSKQIRLQPTSLPHKYWFLLGVVLIFTLGNSSDAFLILQAQQSGITLVGVFLFLALYSGISSISGYFFTSLSDRVGRKKIIMVGWGIYGIVYVLFSQFRSIETLSLLFCLYGFYLGLTEGTVKAWIADIVGKEHKATAFGIFQMSTGLMLLPASLLTGVVWQVFGLQTALLLDGGIAFIAMFCLLFLKTR